MPRDTTYFQDTEQLFCDPDAVVSSTAELLYFEMRSRWQESGCTPTSSGSFNILYFFQSTIHALLRHNPRLTLTCTAFPYACQPIHAINWPDRIWDPAPSECAHLADRYVQAEFLTCTPQNPAAWPDQSPPPAWKNPSGSAQWKIVESWIHGVKE